MPIPETHMKERLSVSYVSAVAARAGVACRFTTLPEYGTDGYFSFVDLINGKYVDTGYSLFFQIKSSSTCQFDEESVILDLDIEDYNKLANWHGNTKIILIIYYLPPDCNEWMNCSENELIMKKCCFWFLFDLPPCENRSKKRVYIPRSQLLTPEAINILMDKVRSGEI